MTRPVSLLRQLTLRLTLITLGSLTLVAAGLAWETIATVHSIDDSALASQARMLSEQVARDAAAVPAPIRAMFERSDGESIYAIFDAKNTLRDTSDLQAAAALAPFASTHGFFRLPRSAQFRHGMLGFGVQSGRWNIIVAQRTEQQEQIAGTARAGFFLGLAWLLIPASGLSVATVVLSIRRYLGPLRAAATAAAGVGPGSPAHRIPSNGLPAELTPVVQAVNEALDRLQTALATQRHLIADVAHALRTPLAVLTARLDLMDDAVLDPIRADVARMRRLVRQMLELARLDRSLATGAMDAWAPIRLRDVAVDVIEQVAPLALHAQKDIALLDMSGGLDLAADRRALSVIILNLLENGIQHTGPGTTVELALSQPATIHVSDRGPGVDESQSEAIFERFHRGPDAPDGGAGLGLAIVAGLVGLHGGSVSCRNRPGGGACFTVVLPSGVSDGATPMPTPAALRSSRRCQYDRVANSASQATSH